MSAAAEPGHDVATRPRWLRVASYNLLHGLSVRARGALDLAAAADAVAELGAEVVALQEVDRGLARTGGVDQAGFVAERLGATAVFAPALLGSPDGSWRVVGEDDPGTPGYGVAVVSRLPVRAVRRIALPGGGDGQRAPRAAADAGVNPGWDREPRTALAVDVELGDGTVTVATTHLSYLPWRGVRQLRAAVAAVAARPGPSVLLGDLNLPCWPVRLALRDGWRHAGGRATYPAWRPRVQTDQLLVRGDVWVRDLVVAPMATSDHLPLVATLAVGRSC